MKLDIRTFSALLAILLLSAVVIVRTKNTNRAIEGKIWELVSYDQQPIFINSEFERITLEFKAGTYEGSSGCNSYKEGRYRLWGNLLFNSGAINTEIFCLSKEQTGAEDDVMKREKDYMEQLSAVWLIADVTDNTTNASRI